MGLLQEPFGARTREVLRHGALIIVVVLLLTPVMGAGRAGAHAFLNESSPDDGATLPSAPSSVVLHYVEPVVPESVWIQIKRVKPDEAKVSLAAPRPSGDNGERVVQPLPDDLGLGTYRLDWAVTSAVDGHPSMGSLTFEVTGFVASGTAGGEAGNAPTAIQWGDLPRLFVRWLSFASLLLFAGMSLLAWRLAASPAAARDDVAAFSASEVPGEMAGPTGRSIGMMSAADRPDPLGHPGFLGSLHRRGRVLGLISLLLGAAGWFVNLALNADLSLLGLTALRHSPFALISVLVVGTLLVLAPLFYWAEYGAEGEAKSPGAGRRSPAVHRPLRFAPLWAVIGLILLLGFSLSGHAAAIQAPRVSSILLDWVHLGAAAAWLGGMGYLVLGVFPAAKAAGISGLKPGQVSRIAAERFTGIALVSIGLLIVTGIFSAELRFNSLAGIPQSLYGRSLMVKLSAFALMGVAAWVHNRLLRPRLKKALVSVKAGESGEPAGPFKAWRAGIAIEALLGLVVLAAVAVMVTYPVPQREPARVLTGIPDGTGQALTLAGNAERLLVTVTGYPLEPGDNLFRVRVADPFNSDLQSEQIDLRLEIAAVQPEASLSQQPGESFDEGGAEQDARTLRVIRRENGSFFARTQLGEEGGWRLTARVTTPDVSGARTTFTFPVPVPDAKLILDRAADVMEGVSDFKIRERLADGRIILHNVYELSGRRMAYHVENGLEILFTEDTRYTKPPGGSWQSTEAPEERLGLIGYLRNASQVHAVDIVDIEGIPTFKISFLAPRISARMAVWVATDTYHPMRLKMVYPGHYMTWEFYDLGVPNRIEAPI